MVYYDKYRIHTCINVRTYLLLNTATSKAFVVLVLPIRVIVRK